MATTSIPVAFRFGGDDVDDLDVCDSETGGDTERIAVGHAGPLFGRYLIIEAPDLVEWTDAMRRVLDRIVDATLNARQDQLDAERHQCWCGCMLEPDEMTCGATRCNRAMVADSMGLVP